MLVPREVAAPQRSRDSAEPTRGYQQISRGSQRCRLSTGDESNQRNKNTSQAETGELRAHLTKSHISASRDKETPVCTALARAFRSRSLYAPLVAGTRCYSPIPSLATAQFAFTCTASAQLETRTFPPCLPAPRALTTKTPKNSEAFLNIQEGLAASRSSGLSRGNFRG